MKPEDLRSEAEAAELLANIVSYAPDKARLTARAAELRRQADALERGAPGPQARASGESPAAPPRS